MEKELKYLNPEDVPYQLYLSVNGKPIRPEFTLDDVLKARNRGRGTVPEFMYVKVNNEANSNQQK